MKTKIDSFKGDYYFLSNFYPSPIRNYEGYSWPTVENGFQAMKADPEDRADFIYLTPSEAKKLGGKVELRKDWEKVKLGVMEDLVRMKFQEHEHLRKSLLKTGDAELIEGNDWNDKFWGMDNKTWKGQNHLGKILMKIRKELAMA